MGKSTWTYEQCCEEARKYKTKIEFRNNSRRAYDAAYRHNWMKDFTWFEEIIKPCNYWTYERCYEEAKKYKTFTEFHKNCSGASSKAFKKGWLKEWKLFETREEITFERCAEIASNYQRIIDFKKENKHLYDTMLKNGWVRKIFKNKGKKK